MKTKIEVDLKPFNVPNYVQDLSPVPKEDAKSIALERLDAETLEAMCEEFTNAVFNKAGKDRSVRFEE